MSIQLPMAMSEGHEILNTEFCPGYVDAFGKWNTGFYCPQMNTDEAVYCCGTEAFKYCCTAKDKISEKLTDNLTLILGIVAGILLFLLVITFISCLYCRCCLLYKKRQTPPSNNLIPDNNAMGPLYRVNCSSTASGVANMYSFSNQNSSATTPIDGHSSHLLMDIEPLHSNYATVHRNRAQNTFSSDRHHSRNNLGRGYATLPRDRCPNMEPPPPYQNEPRNNTGTGQSHRHQSRGQESSIQQQAVIVERGAPGHVHLKFREMTTFDSQSTFSTPPPTTEETENNQEPEDVHPIPPPSQYITSFPINDESLYRSTKF